MPLHGLVISVLHGLLVAVYGVAPVVAIGRAVAMARRQRPGLLVSLGVSAVVAVGISVGVCYSYAMLGAGRMMPGQVALGAYWVFSMIVMLRGFHVAMGRVLAALGPAGAFLRAVVVMCVALPWVMGAVMVYRPRVRPVVTPASFSGWGYEAVNFPAADGSRVSGYFIPAARPGRGGVVRADWGTTTVIVAHGFGGNKGSALVMSRELVPAGFNVLSIDLRGHGESGGQLSTFGVRESADVLGAVQWLKTQKKEEAERVVGVGDSLGAAALLTAAVKPGGEAIEALALMGTYGDLGSLATSLTLERFPGPLGFLLRNVAVPVAEVHAGTPLRSYRPAEEIGELWPRPVLVIHATKDEVISVAQGRMLFEAASVPKDAIWTEGTHSAAMTDEGVARAIVEFFRRAKSVPVV